MRKIFAFLAGVAFGGLVGGTLAILMTPYKGEDLRDKAQERLQEIRSQVIEAGASRRAELEQQLQALRSPRRPPAQ